MPIGQLPDVGVPAAAGITQQGPLSGAMTGIQIGQDLQQNQAQLLSQQLQNQQLQYQTDQMLQNAGLDAAVRQYRTSLNQFNTQDIQSGAAFARQQIQDSQAAIKAQESLLNTKSQQMLIGGQTASTIQNFLNSNAPTDGTTGPPVTAGASSDPYKLKIARDMWSSTGTLPSADEDDTKFLDQVDQYSAWNKQSAPMVLAQMQESAKMQQIQAQGDINKDIWGGREASAQGIQTSKGLTATEIAQIKGGPAQAFKALMDQMQQPGFSPDARWQAAMQLAASGMQANQAPVAGAQIQSIGQPGVATPAAALTNAIKGAAAANQGSPVGPPSPQGAPQPNANAGPTVSPADQMALAPYQGTPVAAKIEAVMAANPGKSAQEIIAALKAAGKL